jgi:2-oxo-3-hexenedioate decarboxylase
MEGVRGGRPVVGEQEARMDIDQLAREIREAREGVRQVATFTSRIPGFDMAAAYEVLHRNHARRLAAGFVPVGRKIGFTNPAMWARYGVREPIWGYVYGQTVARDAASRDPCRIGQFTEPKIEPEIVLHFRAAPPAGGDRAAILACVDWIANGFEIVQSHYAGWNFQAPDTVADESLHARLLVGEPREVARLGPGLAAALEAFTVALTCDGVLREEGCGANVLGSPLEAIAHLVAVLARQPQYAPLAAGEIVTTGTLTTAQSIIAGESWQAQVAGIALPGLSVRFEP